MKKYYIFFVSFVIITHTNFTMHQIVSSQAGNSFKNVTLPFITPIITQALRSIPTNTPSISNLYPNKPIIERPLPPEAYKYIFDLYENEFSILDKNLLTKQNFIHFLNNRLKNTADQTKFLNEHPLYTTLSKNFNNNPNLLPENLPFCVLAVCIQSLYFHQLISELTIYPDNYILSPFEQEYPFELSPMPMETFNIIKNNTPPLKLIFYSQTVTKEFINFLLQKFNP